MVQVVADMAFEELEAASAAEDALLVAFVKGGPPLVLPREGARDWQPRVTSSHALTTEPC